MNFIRHDVSFASDGVMCSGWLFAPDGPEEPGPAVVMAHGFGAVKENGIEVFAEHFADAGLVTLVFDYRYLGASGGEPRQQILIQDQLEDFRNAITWLARHPHVDADRIGLWGTSLAGGHVLQVAAHDRRVKAVVSQVPMVDLWETLQRMSSPDALDTMRTVLSADREQRYGRADRATMPLVAPSGQLSALGSTEYDRHMRWQSTSVWLNEITIESIERMIDYRPASYVSRISPTPLLMIVATGDRLTPPEMALTSYQQALEPKKLVLLPVEHYAVYEDPDAVRAAADAAAEWFTQHLAQNSDEITVTAIELPKRQPNNPSPEALG